jgi:uncharacterized RDD family membrane protein YckC
MRCKDCGFRNGEDDHRCLMCGRRLAGIVIAAPVGYSGANALAMAPDYEQKQEQAPLVAAAPDRNVIPFDQIRQRFLGLPVEPVAPAAPPPAQKAPAVRKAPSPPSTVEQGSLDFVRATNAPRTLRNQVPAQIYCEQTVATPQHRLVASAIDAAIVLLAFGAFALVLELTGAGFGSGKTFWMMLGVSFALISGFYGLIWAIAGRETAGMDMADLQLITFDGFAVDPRSRAIRFASTWLSFCSGGLGLVWAIADEENLTWHDHISKTFPTFREVPRNFVKQRRK